MQFGMMDGYGYSMMGGEISKEEFEEKKKDLL